MEYMIVGLFTFFNMAIIKWKLEKHRYEDAALDSLLLLGLSYVFSGSYGGLVVAVISSAMMSLYFIASPPTFMKGIYKKLKEILDDELH